MRPRRVLILVNPFGGKKKATQVMVEEIMPILLAAGVEVTVRETERPLHALEIVQDLDLDAYDVVATASGDGLIHEVINGLMSRTAEPRDADAVFGAISLAVIPTGSGNAMAHSLGIDTAIDAAYTIVKGMPKGVDLMRVERPTGAVSYAAVLVEWALVADVDFYSERLRWMGGLRFDVEGIRRVLKGDVYTADLRAEYVARYDQGALVTNEEGEPEQGVLEWEAQRFQIFVITNTAFQAKTTQLTPFARVDDGTLDLAIVKAASRVQLLRLFTQVAAGAHVSSPLVEYYKVTSVALVPHEKPGAVLGIDGEFVDYGPLDVSVLPRRVPFLVVDSVLDAVVAKSVYTATA